MSKYRAFILAPTGTGNSRVVHDLANMAEALGVADMALRADPMTSVLVEDDTYIILAAIGQEAVMLLGMSRARRRMLNMLDPS